METRDPCLISERIVVTVIHLFSSAVIFTVRFIIPELCLHLSGDVEIERELAKNYAAYRRMRRARCMHKMENLLFDPFLSPPSSVFCRLLPIFSCAISFESFHCGVIIGKYET
jgi:hypothetical protein